MITREQKLAKKLKDKALAAALVAQGLDLPSKIKAAGDEELEAVRGIGPATRKALRKQFPKAS